MKCFIDWLVEKQLQADDLPFELTKDEIISWVTLIHKNLLSQGKKPYQGRPYGECTEKNSGCELCLYQSWLEEYKQYCINFKE